MADVYDQLADAEGFDWDDGNAPELWARLRVSPGEAEQAFFRAPVVGRIIGKECATPGPAASSVPKTSASAPLLRM